MTKEDKGHFAKKHEENQALDRKILEAIRERAVDDDLPCAVAFSIAEDLDVSPAEVGRAVDIVEKHIIKCQLGLFGYGPRKSLLSPPESIDPELSEAIHQALVDGRLPCRAAWDIAKRLGIRKMAVSSACEGLGIKISRCQLGAF
ncbi:MAG: hypothetical protein JRH13_02685 [Deltaproteobacteria bacterium]|nr:hypothetical protein [Deltaproteobacteria bacterium]MBW2018021.1 hypothetical protein [Deltaproteobacteria bacterium]MBW2128253.1 hypothetical protein [Deltaproteobacteria bacterium]MBW2302248.1 hypothetical protein [Deltaproteobacteria bacterium]